MEIKKHYAYFSAAIRDGAALYPEHRGPYVKRNRDGEICGVCAVGAGLIMCGLHESSAALGAAYPYMTTPATCPEDGCVELTHPRHLNFDLTDVAIILFETHKWTREAIADWLYAEEEKLGFVTLVETGASPALSLGITNAEQQVSVSALTN